ncbi:MAG: hypothetical protein KF724_00430 [Phycisphaeraceae bacterium]|nr:hypothetical protein [Phycisphaeraceae bacterium]
MNSVGGWCGYRYACFPSEAQLPVYCPPGGPPQVLPMPPGAGPKGAQAVAVNDSGVVVGFSYQGTSGSLKIGCIWMPDGSIEVIPPAPGALASQPFAMNNAGAVVGISYSQPYVWANGVHTVIPIPPGVLTGGYATDISDSGFVVGEFGHHSNGTLRGFRWRDGEFEVLEPAESYTVSRARGVNDAGVAVGASRKYSNGVYVGSVATVWTKESIIALPSLPGHPYSYAMSINSSGVIVGGASLNGYADTNVAVVWVNGEPHRLSDLLVAGSPFISNHVLHLNDAGQIVMAYIAQIVTPISAVSADLTGDCAVDGNDIAKVLAEWGVTPWTVADVDKDGVVGGRDLALVLGEWTGPK